MIDDGTDPLRSAGALAAAMGALAEVGRRSVPRPDIRAQKIRNTKGDRGRASRASRGGASANTAPKVKGLNPNETVVVEVELPVSMVVAAGKDLNGLVYEGLRNRLNERGVQWFGPRFLRVMKAEQIRAANKRQRLL